MMGSNQRSRRRFRRRKPSSERVKRATKKARAEAQAVARAEREAKRQAQAEAWRRGVGEFKVAVRGAAMETRRRLRPLTDPLVSRLARVAPYISGVLMLFVRVPAALIAILLDVTEAVVGWVRGRVIPFVGGLFSGLASAVTPVRMVAVVAAGAAVALAASQFVDYRGVAVGEPQYEGEIGVVAPVPLTDLKPAGSAHFYALVPLAVLAIALIPLTVRGRWRLGRAISLIGLIGIAVGVLVDVPQGLDAGRAGSSYFGTDAHLIEGFWAQMASSAVLVLCGVLLGLYAKQESAHEGWLGRRRGRGRARSRRGRARAGSKRSRRRASRPTRASGEAGLEPGT